MLPSQLPQVFAQLRVTMQAPLFITPLTPPPSPVRALGGAATNAPLMGTRPSRQGGVQAGVVSASGQFKVLDTVVGLIFIPVVADFLRRQIAPKVRFHHKTVFEDVTVEVGGRMGGNPSLDVSAGVGIAVLESVRLSAHDFLQRSCATPRLLTQRGDFLLPNYSTAV